MFSAEIWLHGFQSRIIHEPHVIRIVLQSRKKANTESKKRTHTYILTKSFGRSSLLAAIASDYFYVLAIALRT